MLRQLIFYFLIREIGKVYQLNNSATLCEKPIRSERFLNQMVKVLVIIIDRRPKGKPRKSESQTIEKIGCVVPIFSYLI